MRLPVWILFVIFTCAGCLFPGTRVKKNPGDRDCGIRYYRPKPYLLISPWQDDNGLGREEFVTLKLQYLPDFSEEYSLHITPGIGSANVEVTLDQGWNLTQINQELDSQFDENLRAVADLAGEFARTAKAGRSSEPAEMVVQATNVPLGFYESVVGRGPTGKKQLYGWRYVGFAPFNACPTQVVGGDSVCCEDPSAAIYGLAFQNGVMVFRPLSVIASVDESGTTRIPRPDAKMQPETVVTAAEMPAPTRRPTIPPGSQATEVRLREVNQRVRAQRDVLQLYGDQATVTVRLDGDRQAVIFVVRGAIDDLNRRARTERELAQLEEVERLRASLGHDTARIAFLYE